MKIILTAFGRKLVSEPMDWPEDKKGQDFYLVMDMDRLKAHQTFISVAEFDTVAKRAKFIPTGGHHVLPDGKIAEEYKLVDIS